MIEDIDKIYGLLQKLQSRVFTTRRAAATELAEIKINPSTYPNVEPTKLSEFEHNIRQAANAAIDPELIKHGMRLMALAPGFIGIVLCLLLQLLHVLPGTVIGSLWVIASIWVLFWYFRTFRTTLNNVTAPARDVIELGRRLGILKVM